LTSSAATLTTILAIQSKYNLQGDRDKGFAMAMIPERQQKGASARPLAADAATATKDAKSQEPPGHLVIGEGLEISGEISRCSTLKVAGSLRASVRVEELVVDRSGTFDGEAVAQKVRIAGRFDGKLRAESELVVVAGGRVDGEVSYRGLQVEPGGVICGKMDAIEEDGEA
jgi:cytoskeletal protein CcmA (bactofilin family)